jgi:hypothetical protein
MLDSLEGGERYRRAIYGYDTRGLPIRNLIRHKREYPDPRELLNDGAGLLGQFVYSGRGSEELGTDPAVLASDDDF